MPELTPELLLKLHPGTYWQVWKAGFAKAKNDPNTRKQIAEEYLKSSFTKASPAAQRPQSVTTTDEQATINAQLGLSPEDFHTFAHAGQRGAL